MMTEEQRKQIDDVIKTHNSSYAMAETRVLEFFKDNITDSIDIAVSKISPIIDGGFFEQKVRYAIAKLLLDGKLTIIDGGNEKDFGTYIVKRTE